MGKTILIVESGIPVVPFEQSVILRREHEVLRASSAAEALDILDRCPVDLILVDEILTDDTGLNLCQKIRKDPRHKNISTLLFSRSPESLLKGEHPPVGINEVVRKPIQSEEFNTKSTKLLQVPVRREIRLLVYVQVQGYIQSSLFLCNSVNLSSNGMLLLTARKLKMGDLVLLQITLPKEKDKLRVEGRVVREAKEIQSRLNGYGVQFIGMNQADRDRVDKFFSEEQTKQS